MRQSGRDITPSWLAGIAALSVAFGLSTAIITGIGAVGLLSSVPAVHNPRTVQIGNSAKFVRIKPYQTFASNEVRSREFAREMHFDSSS